MAFRDNQGLNQVINSVFNNVLYGSNLSSSSQQEDHGCPKRSLKDDLVFQFNNGENVQAESSSPVFGPTCSNLSPEEVIPQLLQLSSERNDDDVGVSKLRLGVSLYDASSFNFHHASRSFVNVDDDSGALTVALTHEKECVSVEKVSHGDIILIPDSIKPYGDVDVEKGGSCDNIISLVN